MEWWSKCLIEGIQEGMGGEELEIPNIVMLSDESEKFCCKKEGEK